ncbi:TIGR04282 family arsenosugar biosynthesis glycosyltransferase [Wenyingzhuangia sp. chi5]|uniref:TIGR04282 family arsenosugar biosynthesis glycosyltransferase n=1 Tax=Wenyingzhuangia gilva TaxID=3057677 RepID=A0ABT8VU45_9FLAO|nr:TIGR04282 family arsenosugar biosynthesis glycosyltransferase [Wenyingzhuangia sp. chi5]MDO3695440.1 TIGR04282 family arsenosugar biosynthesis glycosyltransferase [Wenyingzhuangia sp. chi5]
MSKQLLIIFTRKPELGKVKTRLAKDTSDEIALAVYKDLLIHTHQITKNLEVDKWVFYTDDIEFEDLWDEGDYMKMIQAEGDLGAKMQDAFFKGFGAGYFEIVMIGSDVDTLTQEMIEDAFDQVKQQPVIGPSEDGGYYLLGLEEPRTDVFQNKEWGTDTVLRDTLLDFAEEEIALLDELNDIDLLEDIEEDSFLFHHVKDYK